MANKIRKILHDAEKTFHDGWARETPVGKVLVRESFESLTAQENRFALSIIKKAGGFEGKKVLDVGSGMGESSIYFALNGANVTALDISPEMVALCLETARYYNVLDRVTPVVGNAEDLAAVHDDTYDIVFSANVLHHCSDVEAALRQYKKKLKKGGLFISWDPIAYNPAINVYRRLATKVRSEDEHPFKLKDYKAVEKVFPGANHREFWLFTLALFYKYYFIDNKNPNLCRYWKEILLEKEEEIGWWFRPALLLDSIFLKIPVFNLLGWNVLFWGVK